MDVKSQDSGKNFRTLTSGCAASTCRLILLDDSLICVKGLDCYTVVFDHERYIIIWTRWEEDFKAIAVALPIAQV
jgi:hypothetical protein